MTNILIPDTVVFKYEQPVAWYFICGGQIKCKNKVNLSAAKIKEKFLRRVPKCGVIATFIRTFEGDTNKRFTMEHLDKKAFCKEKETDTIY